MQPERATSGLRSMTYETVFSTPVGPLAARADDRGLTQLSFARNGETRPRVAGADPCHGVLAAVKAQIGEYFAGKRKIFDLPLHLEGPQFHLAVWNALCEIPYGETISYGTLARRIGEPEAARAVGAAKGANPIVLIVACHSVLGANGKLVGYGGGLKRKRVLLDLEAGRLALAMV